MQLGYVIGSTVATIKDEKLRGRKLLLVVPANVKGEQGGEAYVAVDTVDAGTGDLVVVTHGSSARKTEGSQDAPVDAVIIAVVDSLEVGGKVTFRK
ncbi:MAG TPA: EutN/CcmL family microcompartment protein [Anaerolineaceae bacterium]|nr:EutN/CcmL family microcompartment protein [Anaerolineaceae bacterium]